MPKRSKTLEDELYYLGLVFLGIGGVALMVYLVWMKPLLPTMECYYSNHLGIYCPGCGGTRAAIALIKGHFLQSFWYHPIVPYSSVVGGGFMLTQTLHRIGFKKIKAWKYHNWYLIVFLCLFGCNFVIKNMLRLIWGITM